MNVEVAAQKTSGPDMVAPAKEILEVQAKVLDGFQEINERLGAFRELVIGYEEVAVPTKGYGTIDVAGYLGSIAANLSTLRVLQDSMMATLHDLEAAFR